MVYAEFGGQTECIMGNSKIENLNLTEITKFKYERKNEKDSGNSTKNDAIEQMAYWFKSKNNSGARASLFLVHFLDIHCNVKPSECYVLWRT